jgi:hypothetical protein
MAKNKTRIAFLLILLISLNCFVELTKWTSADGAGITNTVFTVTRQSANFPVTISTHWTSSYTMQNAILCWNQTGTYLNSTATILVGWGNFTANVTKPAGTIITAWAFGNDTNGNYARTANITFVVYHDDKALYVIGNKVYSNNQEVKLKGVDKWGYEATVAGEWGGTFLNSTSLWNSQGYEDCIDELNTMQAHNINVVRTSIAIDLWKAGIEPVLFKNFTTLAAAKNIYVIIEVSNVIHGSWKLSLPYPPYQEVEGADSVIASQSEFVNFIGNLTLDMRGYSNIMYDPWDEPPASISNGWFTVLQQTINNIASYTSQIVIPEGKIGIWINLNSFNDASTMNWALDGASEIADSDGIEFQNITSPNGNLIYQTQFYNDPVSTYSIINQTVGNIQNYGAYTYSEITDALRYTGVFNVAAVHPVFIGEVACFNGFTDNNAELEAKYFMNTLAVCLDNNLHFCAYMWAPDGVYPLIKSDLSPTNAGKILYAAIAPEEPTLTPTPTPTLTVTPTVRPTTTPTATPKSTPETATPTIVPTNTSTPTNARGYNFNFEEIALSALLMLAAVILAVYLFLKNNRSKANIKNKRLTSRY